MSRIIYPKLCINPRRPVELFVNPHAVDVFRTIFHSFEAGIANAISSSK